MKTTTYPLSAAACALVAALAGCATVPAQSDGRVVPIRWITHESQQTLNEACGYNPTRIQNAAAMRTSRSFARFATVNGCYTRPTPGGVCTIHTMKMPPGREITPQISDFLETLGHESAHCFIGAFHNG